MVANHYRPRKPKTNAELVSTINRYWGQPVARVARIVEVTPTGGQFSYEAIASATRGGLPYGMTALPAGRS